MTHILGWYNHENVGDEAYKIAFPKLFKTDKFTFGEEIKGNPSTIVLGGGDVLRPTFFNKLTAFPNTKKYAMSVNLRKEDLEPKLDQFEKVFSRNYVDHKLSKVQFCPDFAFALEANAHHGKELVKQIFNKNNSDLYSNLIIIVMNSFLCKREKSLARDYIAFDKICYDLGKLMDNTPASFLLVPFGNGFPENDRVSNAFLYANSKFWKKNVLLFDKLSVQDTLDIFAAADAAISTRLHSGIFSTIAGTPFLDLCHHSKSSLYMEFIGKQDWCLNFWHFDYFKAITMIKEFLANKEFYRNQVNLINRNAKDMLYQIIDEKIINAITK